MPEIFEWVESALHLFRDLSLPKKYGTLGSFLALITFPVNDEDRSGSGVDLDHEVPDPTRLIEAGLDWWRAFSNQP